MRRVIQTKQRMDKELREYVINPDIPDTPLKYREIWKAAHPDEPITENDLIHHINGNHDDNRLENLKKVDAKKHAHAHKELDRVQSLIDNNEY